MRSHASGLDVSTTLRRPAKNWGPAADAPTHLPPEAFGIEQTLEDPTPPPAPVRRLQSDSVMTSAPRPAKLVTVPTRDPAPAPAPVLARSHSQVQPLPTRPGSSQAAVRSQSQVQPLPPPPAGTAPAPAPAAPPASAEPPRLAHGSQPDIDPHGPPPGMPSAPQMAMPPYVPFEGGASFDPLALPLPPELAPAIYDQIRRLALQSDLVGADRLLRETLADLTSSLSIVIVYKGSEGLYTLGASEEMPKDENPIIAVGKARRAIVGTHSALLPICTATETIAVVQLIRNPRQNPFGMVDHVTMAALVREAASIMHHLVVKHAQRQSEAEHDKKGLYRAEALENHRNRGQEGVLTELSPGWVKRTYQVLVGAIVIAAAFSYFVHVPTYSSGTGIIVFDGTPVTSPAPGTVDTVYVQPAQHVRKGDVLVKLKADKEEADYAQAHSELVAAQQQFMIDSSDESLRKTLISAQAQTKRAADALEQKTVRASADGTVSDIRIKIGSPLEFGAPILTIVAPGTEPEMWAYLPGSDRPRLRPGQTLQIELLGYQKTREQAKIYEVGRTVIGATEAKRSLGAELADAMHIAQEGSYVLVKAKLPKRTFRAKGRTYNFHPGMPAKTEVKVESKRFVVTLLPSLEKYVE